MKQFLRCLAVVFFCAAANTTPLLSQTPDSTVFDPADQIRVYDPGAPPQEPVSGKVGKWVKTNRVGWNTSAYKAYIYKGLPFRLMYPKNYDRAKKYPLYIFFHGLGEYGTIYDNEYSLYHGGELHKNAVNSGAFDGFLLYPQNQNGRWSSYHLSLIRELVETKMIPQIGIDPFRISVNGLSGGGSAVWSFTLRYTKLVAAYLPISATAYQYYDSINKYKFTPGWHFQGGLDNAPMPSASRGLGNKILGAGGNYRYTEFSTRAHDCWYQAWTEKDYFPFMMRAHKANPWALSGRTEFCPGDSVLATVGVTAGFNGYEWRKNGMLISGATGNQITVKSLGTYDCRVKMGTIWSVWSPVPIVIKEKTATISPDIQPAGLASNVIPAPDGSTSVKMEVPENYTSYNWQREGDTTVLSTTRFLTATLPGRYKVKVSEKYGCSSQFSKMYTVVAATGANGPMAVAGLLPTPVSKTAIQLAWSQHSNPTNNETAFEVYQATEASGLYKLVQVTAADATGATIDELKSNTKYFYKVRAVNGNAASETAGPVSVITLTDNTSPTSPENLRVTFITRTSVDLLWDPASDDVGASKYDIYLNGVKTYVTENTNYSINNLAKGKTYTFHIKARDGAGNTSPFSNQATATTIFTGLTYKYFEGAWNVLPDFNALKPVKTGATRNIDLTLKNKLDSFAFLWEGYIRIPVSGSYTFRTTSDDGSKLYIGAYSYGAAALVNNDGLHGAQSVDGIINLAAGVYPIAISFFEKGADESMAVSWKTPETGGNFIKIPDSAFAEAAVVNGQPLVRPTNLAAVAASYKKINLSWNDNSSDEAAFELLRSEHPSNNFVAIAKTQANATTFSDTMLKPGTTYYYRIRALNQYGESGFDKEGSGVSYAYYEIDGLSSLPNFNTLSPVKIGRSSGFVLGMQNRFDNFQMKYDGFITIPTSGVYTFYTTSDDGSKLYIGGFSEANLVVNNDGLHPQQEASGTKFLSAGTYPITVTFFESGGDEILSASISGPSLIKQLIPSTMLGNPYANAATLALPSMPGTPTDLAASAASVKTVFITWKDNTGIEDGYELYRSTNHNSNYILIKTLPANTISFEDTGLFSNSIYYYKVKAVNAGGGTSSNEDSARTNNHQPCIAAIENQYIKFGTQLPIPVLVTDADPETIGIQVLNMPSFGNLIVNENGNGTLTLNPLAADQGTYDIQINATDQNGGSATITFRLVVSDNHNPVLNAIGNINLNEKVSSRVLLMATDADANEVLNWSFKGLPSFATATADGNNMQLHVLPGFADAGEYKVEARVTDSRNGFDTATFTIFVSDIDVQKTYYVNFNGTGNNASGVWNNLAMAPAPGASKTGFKDTSGNISSVGLKVLTNWMANGNSFSSGLSTGTNSGVYPDIVMKTGWYAGKTEQAFQLTGLDTTLSYNLTFFNSKSTTSGNYTTNFTVNTKIVSLDALNNTKNTVAIRSVKPLADGSITVKIKNGAGSSYAHINALILESVYDDGKIPATPQNLTGTYSDRKGKLSWKDFAYNETEYQLFRADSANGSFSKISTLPRNTVSFDDSTVMASRTYYYKVQAVNPLAASQESDTAAITVPNLAPVLSGIADQLVKTDETIILNIGAADDTIDAVTISASNLPAFATLTDNGNGLATIMLRPAINHIGVFKNIAITATDDKGGITTKAFTVSVSNKDLTTVSVNFNSNTAQAAPWNNFNSSPVAGKTVYNLKDENGLATGISIALADAWQLAGTSGVVTGNSSGIFPDNVMKTYYSDTSRTAKRIYLTGLSGAKRYNISFFGSRSGTGTVVTRYSAGGQTVTLNVMGNKSNVVRINGLLPDTDGRISISIMRDSLASAAYINALMIQSYNSDILLTPSELTATALSKSGIRLSWADNSAEESGFEIWRAASAAGSFTLVSTTAANTTTYMDAALAENQMYYYKVRAKSATQTSSFSNVASVSTFAYLVYQNFNLDNPEAAPWNNTNSLPEQYLFFENLKNDQSNPSGISMTIVSNFSGINPNGMIAGNNSGAVPDNVMRASYYCGKGVTAKLRLDGLSQINKYNFVFFASRDGSGDRTTLYTIGNETVSINASYNTAKTVQINGVQPDENGSVFINITHGSASQYGYLNGMIIQGYAAKADTAGSMGILKSSVAANTGGSAMTSQTTTVQAKHTMPEDNAGESSISIYPNPVVDDVTVQVPVTTKIPLLSVKITDMSGRVLSLQQHKDIPAGTWRQQISLKSLALSAGTYFIQVEGVPRLEKTVAKLLKIN